MTPEEKAKELVEKFMGYAYAPWHGGEDEMSQEEAAKQCALLAVEEVINNLFSNHKASKIANDYWQQVKEEINKL